ncbi:zonular occludens toxin domain-containing protein [Variovorax sp. 160MFSha2.1]|uniref:zonular occludens toxin domain-containing protein n=1 Tax=Variovorax sp. 160MFSha2.1 TaxID=3158367 RepID=UPI003AABD698
MFYLRTGGNGSGKTLFTLQDVRKLQLESGRPVYFNIRPENDPKKPNQPYCNLKQSTIDEFGWKPFRFHEWESVEPGAIFLVDECHYDLPKRPASLKEPPHIARLTEHRSYGFDFFLLTQHPKNIDSFVRNLVQAPGWHQHVKRLAGAAAVSNFLQWDAVNLQCEQFGSGKTADVKTRPFPREVYDWYDSAYVHTGKTRIPKAVYVVIACMVLVPLLIWLGVSGLFNKSKAKGSDEKEVAAASSGARGGEGSARPKTPTEYIASYQPRVPGLMHSAPAYDELTRPKRVPVPAACVSMASKGCKCYTQDATPYPVDQGLCESIARHGVFLAFAPEGETKEASRLEPRRVAPETAAAAPSGLVVIGDPPKAAAGPVAAPVAQDPQPRVQPGSKWSFQTGAQ